MESVHRLNRSDRPPSGGKVTHVLRVEPRKHFSVVVCSLSMVGYHAHWDGRRTVRCIVGDTLCPGCLKQFPTRWKGFLTVCNRDGTGKSLLELTPTAAENLEKQFLDGESMRGAIIHCSRERDTIKSPMRIEKTGYVDAGVELPEAVDPEATCMRLWGIPT